MKLRAYGPQLLTINGILLPLRELFYNTIQTTTMKKFLYILSLACMIAAFTSCEKSETTGADEDADGIEVVDLGLSVKWASCNLGASKPEDYGDYYSWGETTTKTDYTEEAYKFFNGWSESRIQYSKYVAFPEYGTVDNKLQLDPSDDAAHVILGGKWRMPTGEEFQELFDNCIWTFQSRKGVWGFEAKSSVNGNSIFFPLAGFRYKKPTPTAVGEEVSYLSSSLYTDTSSGYIRGGCIVLDMDDSPDMGVVFGSRYIGSPIRPVKGK